MLKIAFSVVAILAPCVLMGGTLPVLAKYAIDSMSGLAFRLSWLYFINTAGAVMGCLLGGFYVVERLGLEAGVVGTSLVNTAIGGLFYLFYRVGYSRLIDVPAAPKDAVEAAAISEAASPAGEPEYEPSQARTAFWCISVAGGLTMLYELCWIRLLVMSMGGTVHSFSTMLAGFIFGIAVGSGLIGLALHRRRNALALFALCELGIGLSVLLPLRAYERLPYAFYRLGAGIVHSPDTYGLYLTSQVVFSILLMLVPTALMGAALPLASRVCVDRLESMGRRIGSVFSANTVGSVVGAALTGFVLLPALGLEATFLLGAVASTLVGVVLLRAWRPWPGGSPLRSLRDALSADAGARGPALWPAALVGVGLLGGIRLIGLPSWDARLMQFALYRWERRFEFSTFESFRRARDLGDVPLCPRRSGRHDRGRGPQGRASPAREREAGRQHGRRPALAAHGGAPGPVPPSRSPSRDGHRPGERRHRRRRAPASGSDGGRSRDLAGRGRGGRLLRGGQRPGLAEPAPLAGRPRRAGVHAPQAGAIRRDRQRAHERLGPRRGLAVHRGLLPGREVSAAAGRALHPVGPALLLRAPHRGLGGGVLAFRVPVGDAVAGRGIGPAVPGGPRGPAFRPRALRAARGGGKPAEGLAARNPHVRRLADPVLFLLSQFGSNAGTREFWAKAPARPYRDQFPRMEFMAARAQFVGKPYAIYADLDERLSPLAPSPCWSPRT